MLPHNLDFRRVKLSGFLQNSVGNSHFPYIVQHGSNPDDVLILVNLHLRNILFQRPCLIYLNGIRRHTVYVRPRFLRVAQFSHLDHPQNDGPRHLCAFNSHSSIVGKMQYQGFVFDCKGDDVCLTVLCIYQLQHTNDVTPVGF